MGKAAFLLGVVGSVVAGVLLSSRLVHRDFSASIAATGVGHTCPTLGVRFDQPPDSVPREIVSCACAEAPQLPGDVTPVHPPGELVAAATTSDQLAISWTEFTNPLTKKKSTGLSYTLVKGADRQTLAATSGWTVYSSFALLTALPLLGGIALAVLAMFLPKKSRGTGSFS